MRGCHRTGLILLLAAVAACAPFEAQEPRSASKNPASVRAQRRAFDGAPPIIPHEPFSATCTSCHNRDGLEVPGVGFAPNMPHADTIGIGKDARCDQCHVYKKTDTLFVESKFTGLRQDLRKGKRHHILAPPVMPHSRFMRENCTACHSGPAAREEIRCDHTERANCTQCHVERKAKTTFPPK